MWELEHKEGWAPKNSCFWTVVLEKTLESPLDCKEIQPVHPKGDQAWVFIGRTDVEAETPILWPPDVKNWLIWKDPDAGKDWRHVLSILSGQNTFFEIRSWWWTGRPGVLWFMGLQRVGHYWATELSWTELIQSIVLQRVRHDCAAFTTRYTNCLFIIQVLGIMKQRFLESITLSQYSG